MANKIVQIFVSVDRYGGSIGVRKVCS